MTVTPANVIITGAGRGIGHAILVHLLGLPNPPNILAFSRNIEPIKPLVDVHKNLEAVSVDFSAPSAKLRSQITESIDRMISKFGGIDSVILNHSSLDPIARIQDADLEQWETTYQVNLFSNVELIKAVLPELRRAKGRVVMVSSGAAELFFTGWSAYGSTKAALNHLASSLAHEESEITTVAIAPGIVDTDMQQALRETHGKVMPSQEHSIFVTMKENGTIVKPENVGAVLGNLCLNATTELSGKFLNWDDEKLVAYR